MEDNQIEVKNVGQKIKKLLFFLFRIALAVGVIFYLIYSLKDDQKRAFLEGIKNYNLWWYLPAALLYLIHLIYGAWRWNLLLKIQNIKLSFFEAFALTMKSFFLSLVIPGGALGGDLAKIAFIAKRVDAGTKVEGAFSIIIDRITGMIALFATSIIVCLFNIDLLTQIIENNKNLALGVFLLIFISIFGLIAGIAVFFHRQFEKVKLFKFFIDLADKYSKGTVKRLFNALDLYKEQPKIIILTTIGSVFFIHLIMPLLVFCLMQGIAGVVNINIGECLSAIILGNTAGVVPLFPGGIGLRELIVTEIFSAGDVAKNVATLTALLYLSVILLFNLMGGIFMIIDFGPKKKA
ncbi:lysylphosphatidylglycerol synthase transmembrane domain-containing protein [Lentisphaerota bacterium WC36G]|nr:flippase-like domain-containing protein [Lentisphaerae bacterium WC36]